ncbi:ATP-binding protein [Caballeronia sp. LP006]|uniref:PAS domain-containing hybrid sensor histidine kinase/response regulator n=1 Tax=Caballeronia sp. LP006 TaxID=3038552 RepID=UPI0038D50B97
MPTYRHSHAFDFSINCESGHVSESLACMSKRAAFREGNGWFLIRVNLNHPTPTSLAMALPIWLGKECRVAQHLRGIDWAQTSVGPIGQWDACLQGAVASCLTCSFPACVMWGEDLTVIPNRELCECLGMEAAVLVGTLSANVWTSCRDTVLPVIHATLRQRSLVRSRDDELPFTRGSTGEQIYFAVSCSPIYDSDGEAAGALCIFNETTEFVLARQRIAHDQKAVKAARRLDEDRLQAIIDQLPAGVGLTDATGRWILSNALMRRYIPTAVPSTLPERATLWQAWDAYGDPIPPHEWPGARALRGETVTPGQEMLYLGVPGHRIWMRVSAAPLRDEAQNLVGTCSVVQDISDLKDAEQALKEADHRKNEFLAVLAHELRNPLAPIRTGLNILEHTLDAETRSHVHRMFNRQMAHIVRLVDDLLEVSRITSGKIELRKEQLNLPAILSNAIEISRPAIDRGQHRLTVRFSAEPLTVHGDPVRLTQIFANLLNNAAKYTNAGGHIELTTARDNKYAIVSVRDNGIGISANMLPRIFDMFSQEEKFRKHAQGGLGIGLTLVRSLVQLHGGTVLARSDGLDKGSELIVHLPLIDAPTSLQTCAAENAPFDQNKLVGKRLLIVDDNVDAAESLALLLSMLGAQTRTVHGGLAALDALKTVQVDAVLLDVGMPDMDGYELARRIRATKALAALTLIAITGWGQHDDRQKSRAAGIDHHLVKPVDIVLLLNVLTVQNG